MSQNIPRIPDRPRTVPDMGMTIMELRDELETLTRTDIPEQYVSMFSMVLTTSEALVEKGLPKSGGRIASLALRHLRLRVSIKGKRVDKLLDPIQLELHKEQRKTKEDPQI